MFARALNTRVGGSAAGDRRALESALMCPADDHRCGGPTAAQQPEGTAPVRPQLTAGSQMLGERSQSEKPRNTGFLLCDLGRRISEIIATKISGVRGGWGGGEGLTTTQ